MMENHKLIKFKNLFTSYHPVLCNVANNLIKNKNEAEDLVQEVFWQLWKNRDSISWDKSLKGYLYKATINQSLNWIKKNERMIVMETETERTTNSIGSVQEIIEARELEEIIMNCINALPPKCRIIFLLNRSEGMKYKEIADQLDISIKTVENQIGIALKRLRKEVLPYVNYLIFIIFYLK